MLTFENAAAAIDFYAAVFDAHEIRDRVVDEAGKVAHAEIIIGDAVVWIVDEYPEFDIVAPATVGGTTVQMIAYVPDVDNVFERAAAAGATIVHPIRDQSYEERSGRFDDPFGYRWSVRTLIGSRASDS